MYLNECLLTMPHNFCIPDCCKKGYRMIEVDGRVAKVSFHSFPDVTRSNLRNQWITAIRRDVGK